MWVFFLYTDVDRDPSSWWVTKVSRKESDPFDSFSMVNLIVGSTVLRWSRNRSTMESSIAMAMESSSLRHFRALHSAWLRLAGGGLALARHPTILALESSEGLVLGSPSEDSSARDCSSGGGWPK